MKFAKFLLGSGCSLLIFARIHEVFSLYSNAAEHLKYSEELGIKPESFKTSRLRFSTEMAYYIVADMAILLALAKSKTIISHLPFLRYTNTQVIPLITTVPLFVNSCRIFNRVNPVQCDIGLCCVAASTAAFYSLVKPTSSKIYWMLYGAAILAGDSAMRLTTRVSEHNHTPCPQIDYCIRAETVARDVFKQHNMSDVRLLFSNSTLYYSACAIKTLRDKIVIIGNMCLENKEGWAGTIAHELGHIYHNDIMFETIIRGILYASCYGGLCYASARGANLATIITAAMGAYKWLGIMGSIMGYFIELRADAYAFKRGHGKSIKKGLLEFKNDNIYLFLGPISSIFRSHPATSIRLNRVNEYLNNDANQSITSKNS